MRAFAAVCPGNAAVPSQGACTNIEITGPALGAGTPASQVPGYHPADLQSAYKLPSATAGGNQTIGIVVAGLDPNASADLAVYRSTFGLPPCSTTVNNCLTILAAPGVSTAPAPAAPPPPAPAPGASPVPAVPNQDWAREAATDLDMASAICPNCRLILYTAKSNADTDLAAAITGVINAGATVVSNSYAIPEAPGESPAIWMHTFVPIVAAAGDQGYGTVNWPAAAPNVIAVGATTLLEASNPRGWSETVWNGTGSGCSTIAVKPLWQTDQGCPHRTVSDVAAVGDPETPVAVYDTYQDNGWVEVGGTSVSTPIIAGVYALAGNNWAITGAASIYTHQSALNPISSGTNGTCTTAYLCTAAAGYNGPAGLGSPNGVGAF